MITSPNFTPPASSNSLSVAPVQAATAIFFNPSSKDTGWLTLDVCREFTRNKCTRADHQCRFAHPTPNVEIQNGRVTCCFDSIKGKCQRKDPPCKYLHPPQHLKEQLLQNGRNNLMLRHQHMQLVSSVFQQQQQQQQQHLITGPAAAIYPVVYDANGNKAYNNPVTMAPISDAHYFTTPYMQQGLYYAPYATTTQQHLQQFNVLAPDAPVCNYTGSEVNNHSNSPAPPTEHLSSNQHLQNQAGGSLSTAEIQAPSITSKSEQRQPKNQNKVQYYPTLSYNPYNVTNNGNDINNNNTNNYFSCQQMAYATIPTGFAFPVAISGHPSPAAILPRY